MIADAIAMQMNGWPIVLDFRIIGVYSPRTQEGVRR
jgi:hypothetical protein